MHRFTRLWSFVGLLAMLGGCGLSSAASATDVQNSVPPTQGVSVQLDHTSYHNADVINATIQNHLSTPIYAHDTAASCTIVLLQQQVNGTWQTSESAKCPIKRPAMVVKLDAGASLVAKITASYPGLEVSTFAPGTYRLVLPYSTSPDALPTTNGAAQTTSTSFTVLAQGG